MTLPSRVGWAESQGSDGQLQNARGPSCRSGLWEVLVIEAGFSFWPTRGAALVAEWFPQALVPHPPLSTAPSTGLSFLVLLSGPRKLLRLWVVSQSSHPIDVLSLVETTRCQIQTPPQYRHTWDAIGAAKTKTNLAVGQGTNCATQAVSRSSDKSR